MGFFFFLNKIPQLDLQLELTTAGIGEGRGEGQAGILFVQSLKDLMEEIIKKLGLIAGPHPQSLHLSLSKR